MPDKRYKVTGTQPVLQHQPGDTFTATFSDDEEGFLLRIGAIKNVGGPKPKKDDKKD